MLNEGENPLSLQKSQKKIWVVLSFSAKKSLLSPLAEVKGRKHTCNGLTLVRCLSVSCRTDMSCVLPLSSLLPSVITSDETQTPDTRGTNFTTVVKLCHLPTLGFPRCPHCHSLSIHFPPGPPGHDAISGPVSPVGRVWAKWPGHEI